MQRNNRTGLSRRPFILFLLAFALLTFGCQKKQEPSARGTEGVSSELQQMVRDGILPELHHGEISGDHPVWPEGTTFSARSRDETIMIRTQALDRVYRRARDTYGEELEGRVSLKFTIYPDGTIGPIRLLDANWSIPAASALTDSMIQRVQQWTFPPGLEKAVDFTQPWRFSP